MGVYREPEDFGEGCMLCGRGDAFECECPAYEAEVGVEEGACVKLRRSE